LYQHLGDQDQALRLLQEAKEVLAARNRNTQELSAKIDRLRGNAVRIAPPAGGSVHRVADTIQSGFD
jgi:hypothetical protein